MLGALLHSLRERAGLPMTRVVVELGVPRATAYAWEGADSRPEPENLKRLLDLYGATDDERLHAWELRGEPRPARQDADLPNEAV